MVLERNQDSSFPRVYDTWETADTKWVIQDLPPEDDENLIELLAEHLCSDEVLCSASGLSNNPKSVKGICDFWRESIAKRTSLACYKETGGTRSLVGANVCLIAKRDDYYDSSKLEGEEWVNVYNGLEFLKTKCDPFKYLNVDVLLIGMGLVVKRECRGDKLGSRILNAREPLCKHLGIAATSTVFTGVGSQISAARCGFISIGEATLGEMAEAGLNYPKNDQRVVKLMVKQFKNIQ
ncbi:uncharacterized protein [Battus philenor]|uniref:uncharacterized protein n=1 Tax=Battus philenor TaxID=42288 RepID=UPI0035CEDD21